MHLSTAGLQERQWQWQQEHRQQQDYRDASGSGSKNIANSRAHSSSRGSRKITDSNISRDASKSRAQEEQRRATSEIFATGRDAINNRNANDSLDANTEGGDTRNRRVAKSKDARKDGKHLEQRNGINRRNPTTSEASLHQNATYSTAEKPAKWKPRKRHDPYIENRDFRRNARKIRKVANFRKYESNFLSVIVVVR
jgi:hypothetical protein